MIRVVLTGGGTGGHFYPLIAIAEGLGSYAAESGVAVPELYYMGPDRYDAEALEKLGIAFISCPSGKTRRYWSALNVLDFFKLTLGVIIAIYKLWVVYPDVIMSKGGYTSVPIVFAGWFLRIPIIVHESDAVPGRGNAFAAKFARYIAVSYSDTADFFPPEKTALTGIPMRRSLLEAPRVDIRGSLGIDSALPIILVLGGSQGAERINQLILESLDELLPRFAVIHQTGPAPYESFREMVTVAFKDEALRARYHPVPFFDAESLNSAMHAASLIISRAGSGTIHEIAAHGKPSILIPIPEHISHDQRTNAYAYARTGAASVLEEQNMRDGLLEAEINRIMGSETMYQAVAQAAASFGSRTAGMAIAEAIMRIGQGHE